MFTKKKKALIITLTCLPYVAIGFIVYVLFGERYLYARSFASDLYHYPLPAQTKIINRNFDYGVFFAGGPSGSGGYPTIVAFIEIESKLSSKEIYNYYDKDNVFSAPGSENKTIGFEIYFEDQQNRREENGKVWYEKDGGPVTLTTERKGEKPTKAIIQIKTEYSHPLFIDWN
jgi:hypothetical protein